MWKWLSIEEDERGVFAWGVAVLIAIGWADVSVKNAAEIFFIKRVGPDLLPLAFLLSSALLVATTYIAVQLTANRDRLRLLPRVLVGLGLILLPLWLLVRVGEPSSFWLLLMASKQIQSIALLAFWVALGDLFHGRQAKRLYAPLLGGYTLGQIVGSFASAPLGGLLGIDGLLPVSAGILCLGGVLALPLHRSAPARLERNTRPLPRRARGSGRVTLRAVEESPGSFGDLWREGWFFRLLVLITVCSGLLGPMLYFQFQYVANAATAGAGGEDRLLSLYSQFRGWLNAGVLVGQLAVASRLYRRIGVPLATAFSPMLYLLGFSGLSFWFSLPAGVAARAGTKLQDNAIYEPALRILYNLFPEEVRSRATTMLEGPIKRAGGAAGNLTMMVILAVASAGAVGYVAIPIAGLWLIASLRLWRAYPALLLRASTRRASSDEEIDLAEMLDPGTLRELSAHLNDPDPAACSAAIALVSVAEPRLAAGALAEAARQAPDATRSLLVAALDRLLERSVSHPFDNDSVSDSLEALLAQSGALDDRDRADIVQAFGRLVHGEKEGPSRVLVQALEDVSPAVRLAALAALVRRGGAPAGAPDLDATLRAAAESGDPVERRTAREELRALLLETAALGQRWSERLALLAGLLESPGDRVAVAEAIAEIAERHGQSAAAASDAMMAFAEDTDPCLRAALLRFCGWAARIDRAEWIVRHLSSDRSEEVAAARVGLRALGADAADVLLVGLSYGKRSARNAILSLLRELRVKPTTLRDLYDRELRSLRQQVANFLALRGGAVPVISLQRVEERIEEGLHTLLLFLAALRNDDRIAELCDLLRRGVDGRQRAILLEALEAFLPAEYGAQLIPLLEYRTLGLRGTSAEAVLGVRIASFEQACAALREDPDELTRMLAATMLDGTRGLAGGPRLTDHHDVLSPVEISLHLKSLPLFEQLSIRQLVDLAQLMRNEKHAAGVTIISEGETSDCIYLVLEGTVEVTKGVTKLAEFGPNEFFGEMGVLEGANRSANVVARVQVRLLRLERSDLLRMMEELPGIAIAISQTLSRRMREINEKIQG